MVMPNNKTQLVREFLLLTLGTALVAIGVYFFKFPNNFSTGGVTGIAVIISAFVPGVSTSTFASVLNLLFLVLGFVVLNSGFGLRTTYCSLLFSGLLSLLDRFCPLEAPLTDQPILELFFAVILPSLGSAILFNIGGSTGGTDILAMILKKFSSLDIGRALLCCDVLIADPLSFLGFCSLASQILSKSFPVEAIATKPAFFDFQGGKFRIRAENNKTLDVSDLFLTKNKYQKSIRNRLEDLLRRFLSGEICPTAEQVEREKIIGELGQSELFLLAYCFRSPTKPLLDLEEILKNPEHCEQISWAIETLLSTFVPQTGEQVPLLQSNGENTYTSKIIFHCTQLYKRKLPRLPLEALDELAEPALKYYFAEKSANPFDAELRWDALCALERMPAEFILGYSKTKAGEVFFKSFTGDDATYAQYVLDSVAEDDAQ